MGEFNFVKLVSENNVHVLELLDNGVSIYQIPLKTVEEIEAMEVQIELENYIEKLVANATVNRNE